MLMRMAVRGTREKDYKVDINQNVLQHGCPCDNERLRNWARNGGNLTA